MDLPKDPKTHASGGGIYILHDEGVRSSIGLFVRGLTNLKVLLTKGEAHASSRGMDPGSLLTAQLADDMYNLAVQAHWASEGAKLAVHRLLGVVATPLAEETKSFAELHERIDATIAYLGTVDPEALERGSIRRFSFLIGVGRRHFVVIDFSMELRSRTSSST